MIKGLKDFLYKLFLFNLFRGRKDLKLGLYGPPNSGKTSLANRICQDWLGEEMGSVSKVPHETRHIQEKEKINVKSGNKAITFNLVDTPGIATKIDYEDFIKAGLKKKKLRKELKKLLRVLLKVLGGWIVWMQLLLCWTLLRILIVK